MIRRISVFGLPRPYDLDACAASMFELLQRLREISPELTFQDRARKSPVRGRALSSRALCAEALAHGAFAANMGDAKRPVRGFAILLGGTGGVIELMNGIDVDTRPLWRTNRAELSPAPRLAPGAALAVLAAMAQSFDADWGFAGGEIVPRLPPHGRGTPAVGWATFMSMRHGALPALSAPASVMAVQGGAIVVAQPEPFDERRRRDLDDVAAVRAGLGAMVLQDPPLPYDLVDPSIEVESTPASSVDLPLPVRSAEIASAAAAQPGAPPHVGPASEPPPSAPTRPFKVPHDTTWRPVQPHGPPHGDGETGTQPGMDVSHIATPFELVTPAVSRSAPMTSLVQMPRDPPSSRGVRGETAVASDAPSSAPALPFGGGPQPTPEEARKRVSLAVYAAVCAEIRAFPDRAPAVFKRYGLSDPAMRAMVDAVYKNDLLHDPGLRARFEEMMARAHSTMR